MSGCGYVVVVLAGWVTTAAVVGYAIGAIKRRERRDLGRAILREAGLPDFRIANGVNAGRWYSELLCDDEG